MPTVGRPVWHVVHGEDLMAMLHQVAEGADPEVVYIEHYANGEHQDTDDA